MFRIHQLLAFDQVRVQMAPLLDVR